MLCRLIRTKAKRELRLLKERETHNPLWKNDPVLFAEEALGLKCWDRQAEVMQSIMTHDRVAVRSGHKVGKSALLTSTALWWATVFSNAIVIMTMSTARQIKLILWKQLAHLVAKSKISFPAVPKDPGTGLHFKNGSYIVGFSTDDTENMGGFSGSRILFIADEASGVQEEIFEAIEGNMAGGAKTGDKSVAKLMLAGNPTRTSGAFFDAFHGEMSNYSCHHISSASTPNAKSGEVLIPGLATLDYVNDRRKVWGEESPLYQVRVEGNFARQGSNSVIFLDTVCSSVERYNGTQGKGTLHVGIDVARFGDDLTCIVTRRGDKILSVDTYTKFDEVDISGFALLTIKEHMIKGERKPIVKVDTTGIGSGVAAILRRDNTIKVVEVNSASKAVEPEKFINVRSELWFNLSDWLETGAIPDDKDLQKDLVAPLYNFDAQGRQVVEAKKDMKKRLGHSPDRADALALSVYMPLADAFVAPRKESSAYRFDDEARGF